MATKYQPLRAYLASVPADVSEVTLTYAELEAVLGTALPPSALPPSARLRSWWANLAEAFDPPPHARAWHGAGWRVRSVAPGAWVTFARAGP